MNTNLKSTFAALVLAMAATTAQAETVYSQSLNFNADGGPYSYYAQVMYDQFNLSNSASISGAEWYGDNFVNSFGATQNFNVAIYDDVGGSVGSALFSSNVVANVTDSGLTDGRAAELFKFQATFAPVSLVAGHNYWLSITDVSVNASGNDGNRIFRWANGNAGFVGDAGNYYNGSQLSVGDSRAQAAYTLTAAVPEPETYGLMLVGLGMMGFMMRRRKHENA